MRSNILSACAGILITLGIVIILIPIISNTKYNFEQAHKVDEFVEECLETIPDSTESIKTSIKNTSANNHSKLDLTRLRNDVKKYNKQIWEEKQCNLNDKRSYQVASLNLYNYGFQNGIYGYVTVNKLNLNMPIYLGASDYNMSLGAAHMTQTSIPYGGENTHSVISGHCGYGYLDYFRHIDSLQVNDEVIITTPFGKLRYTVCDKVIIKPNEFEPIMIQEGKDLLTLITCYPYPTNKYRCCVICERKNDL